MAQGFLQSFDHNINVFSAGTEPGPAVNPKAIQVMAEAGIDIENHYPENVDRYINNSWDYVITVCDNAKETCPVFPGKVRNRIHIGFDDPSHAKGTEDFINQEFIRVRDEIKKAFYELYIEKIRPDMEQQAAPII